MFRSIRSIRLIRSINRRRLLTFLSSLLLFALVTGVFYKLTSKPALAAWFDDAWAYRTKITFVNSGAADADKKVKFDIPTDTLVTNGKIQSDCGDSRFVTENGEVLKYYLDVSGGACNTNSTDYYVLLPNITVGTNVVYHYYGNPGAGNGTQA
ncbi:MAG: hypothetical protein UX91_C0014G0001, partial [Candidatus Amesbacteria bacterium GW2011_GWB1_47_19]